MPGYGNEHLAECIGYNSGHANGFAHGIREGRKRGYPDGLNAANEHARRIIDECDELIISWTTANEDLAAENAKFKQRIDKLYSLNQGLAAENPKFRKKIDEFHDANKILVARNAEFHEANKRLAAENSEFYEANKRLAEENAKVYEANKGLAAENARLKQKINDLYDANKGLAAESAENTQLKQHIQLQQEQAQSLRAEYEEMFKAFLGVVAIARPAMNAVAKLPFEERAEVLDKFLDHAIELQTREYVDKNRYPSSQPLILKYLPIARQVFDQTHRQIQQQKAEATAKAESAN